MARELLSMRQIKELLRLKHKHGLSVREIARSCGLPVSTVGDYLKRAEGVGLTWPLPEDLTEEQLVQKLLGSAAQATRAGERVALLNDVAQVGAALARVRQWIKRRNARDINESVLAELTDSEIAALLQTKHGRVANMFSVESKAAPQNVECASEIAHGIRFQIRRSFEWSHAQRFGVSSVHWQSPSCSSSLSQLTSAKWRCCWH